MLMQIWMINLKRRDQLTDTGVDGRIIHFTWNLHLKTERDYVYSCSTGLEYGPEAGICEDINNLRIPYKADISLRS